MNKTALIEKIVADLMARIAAYETAARAAHAEATHEESKAEDKYDTRGLEAGYLAQGQARQMAETAEALADYKRMRPRTFPADEGIDIGALVEVTGPTEKLLYFVGPSAGGTEITVGRKTVIVITLQSPIGQLLSGRKAGDRVKMKIDGLMTDLRVTAVS